MAVQRDIDYSISFGDPAIVNHLSVHSSEFDEAYAYDGNDLGITYEKGHTFFRLWAPTASEARVVLYSSWNSSDGKEHTMARAERGTWTLSLPGDHAGVYYTYKVHIDPDWNEAVDPYAQAVGAGGDRGCILDLSSIRPGHWTTDRPPLAAPTDAVIYELHVRDLSMHPNSGIKNKGKFLAFTETGTTGPGGIPTGLDHIKSLGVTHVQLLPIFDYATESVDETKLDEEQYNWGYDPKNYNVPEGSYASDPFDPASRIRELKQAVQVLHDHGLRVIMDVVYNHVYDAYRMSFMKLVPGYYFRYKPDGTLSNGSACGNDTASERRMMQKFIVDSVTHWANEYHIDGFRFDLMGLHDVETMNMVREALDEIDPSILIIGEGWDLATELPPQQKATQQNAPAMPRIAHFNDIIRDGLKGSVFYHDILGFVNGSPQAIDAVKSGIIGGISSFAAEPVQSVAYAEAHDNHTIWDKLAITNAHDSFDVRKAMHKLCTAVILTSQGIPFLHAGQEFMRTKGGDENSYKSPTSVNWLDWTRCAAFGHEVDYVRRLIALRRAHPAFRMTTAADIQQHLVFEEAPAGTILYTLRNHANGDAAKHLMVIHNANRDAVSVPLSDAGQWTAAFGGEHIQNGHKDITIAPFGTVVLTFKG